MDSGGRAAHVAACLEAFKCFGPVIVKLLRHESKASIPGYYCRGDIALRVMLHPGSE